MKHKLAHFYNPMSMIGFILVGVSTFLIIFFGVIGIFIRQQSPYLGIITYIILPFILLIGLILVPWGAYLDRKRKISEEPYPVINFNNPTHQKWFTFFASTGIIILLLLSFAAYEAFEFSESVTFCGTVCHEVMHPEYISYQHSPHARVRCVECHVGSGAGWYVRSKLSGAYQVYSTLFNKYSKPIETPIKNLRPAPETCEQCHWPRYFTTDRVVTYEYYTRESQEYGFITLRMKIGGGLSRYGTSSGIHWHMNIANKVEYIATDEKRLIIPWVKLTTSDGKVRIFQSEEEPLEGDPSSYEIRTMDCMDCHNRPSHIYRSPREIMNALMVQGAVSAELPEIRSIGADVLVTEYSSTQNALDSIRLTITEYYQNNYPEQFESWKPLIEKAISAISGEYQKNFFPKMKVRWSAYPMHTAHLNSPGCFRCHDGKHVDENGVAITNDCNACHVILAQGKGAQKVRYTESGEEFQHPVDIGEAWKEMLCSDCHTGE